MRTRLVLLPCAVLAIATACNAPGMTRRAVSTAAPPATAASLPASLEAPLPPAPAPTPTYGPPPTYVPLPD